MNCEIEMSNSTIISEIEKRMPTKMKDEWASLVTKDAATTPPTAQRFEELMKLLGDWRRKLEYLNASLRSEPNQLTGNPTISEIHNKQEIEPQTNVGTMI